MVGIIIIVEVRPSYLQCCGDMLHINHSIHSRVGEYKKSDDKGLHCPQVGSDNLVIKQIGRNLSLTTTKLPNVFTAHLPHSMTLGK